MKNIKFRVWDNVLGKMFKPQAISFDIQSSNPFAVTVPRRSWEPAEKFELLLWTGFADQNGTDVYEGDLVQISSVVYKVIWNETLAAFELAEGHGPLRCNMSASTSGKVIGNIFEHETSPV